ncbi:MAG TPA: serine/threonine-protein kinase, partial [Pirellulales bacterium]
MSAETPDENFVADLPLPLAQIYRRVFDATSPGDRFKAALSLWEDGIALLQAIAIAAYSARPQDDQSDDLGTETVKDLIDATCGTCWRTVKRLTPVLAQDNVAGFSELNKALFGPTRSDLPWAAGLDALLIETLSQKASGEVLLGKSSGGASTGLASTERDETGQTISRSTVRLSELFDHVIEVRNREMHGPIGRKSNEEYRRGATAMVRGFKDVFSRLDVLAGHRLLLIRDVFKNSSDEAIAICYELCGDVPHKIQPMSIGNLDKLDAPQAATFLAGTVGIECAKRRENVAPNPNHFISLDPLLTYDRNSQRITLFMRPEQFDDTKDRASKQNPLSIASCGLVAKLRHAPLNSALLAEWVATPNDAAEEGPGGPPSSGRWIGEFELLSRLAMGGMGIVYRAYQAAFRRQVALKCPIHPGDHRVEDRFRQEMRALGRVRHHNLVHVYTTGSDGVQWFYAMELIDGAELADVWKCLAERKTTTVNVTDWQAAFVQGRDVARSRETNLNGEQLLDADWRDTDSATPGAPEAFVSYVHHIVSLVRQVADAAGALHDEGVVHRDIKPGNILITADEGRPVLMDLGLAQLADDLEGRLTRTRQFVGTLQYACPEQLTGKKVEAPADVYSLGVTLWELLCLRPMFGVGEQTSLSEVTLRVLEDEAEAPSRYNPRVPRDLDAIVLKCLDKDPRRRYVNGRKLAEDLERWENDQPVYAQPPTVGYILQKKLKRNRRLVLQGAVGLVLLLVAGAAAWFQNERRQIPFRIDSLAKASDEGVSDALDNLNSPRWLVTPQLRKDLEDSSLNAAARTRLTLALASHDPAMRPELTRQLLDSAPSLIDLALQRLRPLDTECIGILQTTLMDRQAAGQARLRAAMGLSSLEPPAEELNRGEVADLVALEMTTCFIANPSSYETILNLLKPVAGIVAPALARIVNARDRFDGSIRETAAKILVDFGADQPEALAEAIAGVLSDARTDEAHERTETLITFNGLVKQLEANRDKASEVLTAIVLPAIVAPKTSESQSQPPGGAGAATATKVGNPPDKDSSQSKEIAKGAGRAQEKNDVLKELDRLDKAIHVANAAAALLRLQHGDNVWPL